MGMTVLFHTATFRNKWVNICKAFRTASGTEELSTNIILLLSLQKPPHSCSNSTDLPILNLIYFHVSANLVKLLQAILVSWKVIFGNFPHTLFLPKPLITLKMFPICSFAYIKSNQIKAKLEVILTPVSQYEGPPQLPVGNGAAHINTTNILSERKMYYS